MRKRAGDPGLNLISRAEIAQRDGWRCGICSKKVRPDLEHPDPYCASIDHVLPLARGGDNSPANLQLAHLRCNLSKKADGIIQARLF
jgi:5-methylcytosine-specific restriction endonuclease McrA